MKNSKNFAKILLFTLITFSSVSCIFADRVKGNGKVVTEERTVKSFDEVSASAGINVVITQDEKEFLEVEADENLLEYIITEVNGTTLKIHWKQGTNVRSFKKVLVHVTCKELTQVRASSGADIYSKGTIKTGKMTISSSSAADIKLSLEAEVISCNASSGADVELKGKTDKLMVSASSGADIEATEIAANIVDAKASSGADISVIALKEINASASSGGDITYFGDPQVKNVKSSSGGSVKQKK